MALKLKLTADEYSSIDQNLQAVYLPDGDGYVLDVDGVEDVSGLKSALQRQKDAASSAKQQSSELQQKLDAMNATVGGDAGLQRLMEIQQQLEQNELLKAMADGNLEFVSEKLVGKNTEAWQKKYDTLQTQLNEISESKANSEKRLQQKIIEGEIRRAAATMLVPTAIDDAVMLGGNGWQVAEDGSLIYPSDTGEPELGESGKPITPGEWLSGLKDQRPHWFAGHSGGGATGGSGGGGARQPWQLSREDANDFNKVKQATKAAQEQGLPSYETIE